MVEKYLKLAKWHANRAYDRLRKEFGVTADWGDLYDDVMDHLIRNVRRLTSSDHLEGELKRNLNYQSATLVSKYAKPQRQLDRPLPEDYDPPTLHSHYEGVEDLLNDLDPLNNDRRELLLKVCHKRDDERLTDIFCHTQDRRWHTKVRPALQQWAEENIVPEDAE